MAQHCPRGGQPLSDLRPWHERAIAQLLDGLEGRDFLPFLGQPCRVDQPAGKSRLGVRQELPTGDCLAAIQAGPVLEDFQGDALILLGSQRSVPPMPAPVNQPIREIRHGTEQ